MVKGTPTVTPFMAPMTLAAPRKFMMGDALAGRRGHGRLVSGLEGGDASQPLHAAGQMTHGEEGPRRCR